MNRGHDHKASWFELTCGNKQKVFSEQSDKIMVKLYSCINQSLTGDCHFIGQNPNLAFRECCIHNMAKES